MCRDITRQECEDVPRHLRRQVPQEVVQEECSLVPSTECRDVEVQEPERQCRTVTTNVCKVTSVTKFRSNFRLLKISLTSLVMFCFVPPYPPC